MKRLYSIATIISIIFATVTTVFATEPAEGINANNFLKLKTHLLDDNLMVDIMVFAYDERNQEWVQTSNKHHRNNHITKLNPLFNYQIWFVDEYGNTKVLFIDKGESGPWYKIIDIDFKDNVYHAKLKQNIKKYDYDLTPVGSDYDKIMIQPAEKDVIHPVDIEINVERS